MCISRRMIFIAASPVGPRTRPCHGHWPGGSRPDRAASRLPAGQPRRTSRASAIFSSRVIAAPLTHSRPMVRSNYPTGGLACASFVSRDPSADRCRRSPRSRGDRPGPSCRRMPAWRGGSSGTSSPLGPWLGSSRCVLGRPTEGPG